MTLDEVALVTSLEQKLAASKRNQIVKTQGTQD
jgi:hypothetical protein